MPIHCRIFQRSAPRLGAQAYGPCNPAYSQRHFTGRRGALAGLAATAALLLAAAGPVSAQQTWPSKPVRMVIPFPAGGATDIIGRTVAAKLGSALGQQVIVENRPGAGGTIGADSVAKAAPDGYTILMATSSTHSIGPAINPKMPYDAVRDFAPVAHIANAPSVLVVGRDSPARTAQELVALLKKNPGKYNFGSSGIGTTHT